MRRSRRLGNVSFWLVNLLLTAFLLGPPVAVRLQFEALLSHPLPRWPLTNPGLSFVFGFLLLDLIHYLVHRCEHAVPLLWRFHALHHSDPDVDVTTSVRHHPIEYILASAFYWLALIVLDIPAIVVLCHGSALFGMAAVQHGNIRLPERLERGLRPAVMTTDLHRVHHSVLPTEANSNYGEVLSIWDRLFGTYNQITPERHEAIVFGVRELARQDCLTPSSMILTPWVISSRYLRR